MSELKPTTTEERAAWMQYYKNHLHLAWPRERALRLIADVDRLEKHVCELNDKVEAGRKLACATKEWDDYESSEIRLGSDEEIRLLAQTENAMRRAREAGLLEGGG